MDGSLEILFYYEKVRMSEFEFFFAEEKRKGVEDVRKGVLLFYVTRC